MGISDRTKRTALLGLLFALSAALSVLEGMVPLPLPLPGMKLGLSNVVTMFCALSLGRGKAALLVILKAMFALLARGLTAGLLSLSGGALSVAVMLLAVMLLRGRTSYLFLGITGAVSHNAGQLLAVSLILRLPSVWYYLPALVIAGCGMGFLTAMAARAALPRLGETLGVKSR